MFEIEKPKDRKEFQNCPEHTGPAVLVDVVDRGEKEVEYNGEKKVINKFTLSWLTDEKMDNGEPFIVFDWFTRSLHPKSKFAGAFRQIMGRGITEEDYTDGKFDVEKLIGTGALVQVTHNQVGEKTYANIESYMKLPATMTAPGVPSDFTRLKDREKNEVVSDDEIPF